MKLYSYHPDTGEYLSITQPVLNPRSPEHPLIPAHCTQKIPPAAPAGKVAVFRNDEWQVMEDHRGEVVYSIHDKSEIKITELGALPDNTTHKNPESMSEWDGNDWIINFEQIKVNKLQEIKAWANTQLKPIREQYPDVERESWQDQKTEAAAFIADSSADTPWLDGISTQSDIDKTTLATRVLEKARDYAKDSSPVIGDTKRMRDLLKAAKTHEDVEAIIIPD